MKDQTAAVNLAKSWRRGPGRLVLTNKEQAQIVTDVIVAAIHNNKSTRPDPIRIFQEMWSEGFTLAERGDDRIWCQFIYEQEKKDSDYWYRRIKAVTCKQALTLVTLEIHPTDAENDEALEEIENEGPIMASKKENL